jgi:hypothetical protein
MMKFRFLLITLIAVGVSAAGTIGQVAYAEAICGGVGQEACAYDKATHVGTAKTCKAINSNYFFDPINGGGCYECPAKMVRSMLPIDSDRACFEPLPIERWADALGFTNAGTAPATWVQKLEEPKRCLEPDMQGSFHDVGRNECWTCRTDGKTGVRSPLLSAVNEWNACLQPATSVFKQPVEITGKSICRVGYSRHGLSTTCYACTDGDRNLFQTDVDAGDACVRAVKATRNAPNHQAPTKGILDLLSCGIGQSLSGGRCFSCPGKSEKVLLTPWGSTNPLPCRIPEYNHWYAAKTEPICSDGNAFLHGLSGKCYSCGGDGYVRTGGGIDSEFGCEKVTKEVFYHAKKTRDLYCPKGTFPAGGDSCYQCPAGFARGTSLVTESNACVVYAMKVARAEFKAADMCPAGQFWHLFDFKSAFGGDGFGCYSCPKNFVRTINPDVNATGSELNIGTVGACESAALRWRTPAYGEPGLFGLPTEDILVDVLARPWLVDGFLRSQVRNINATWDDNQDLNEDEYVALEWNSIVNGPQNNANLNAYMFIYLIEAIVKIEAARTKKEQDLINAFEGYIVERRTYLVTDAEQALSEWNKVYNARAALEDPTDVLKVIFDTPPDFYKNALSSLDLEDDGLNTLMAVGNTIRLSTIPNEELRVIGEVFPLNGATLVALRTGNWDDAVDLMPKEIALRLERYAPQIRKLIIENVTKESVKQALLTLADMTKQIANKALSLVGSSASFTVMQATTDVSAARKAWNSAKSAGSTCLKGPWTCTKGVLVPTPMGAALILAPIILEKSFDRSNAPKILAESRRLAELPASLEAILEGDKGYEELLRYWALATQGKTSPPATYTALARRAMAATNVQQVDTGTRSGTTRIARAPSVTDTTGQVDSTEVEPEQRTTPGQRTTGQVLSGTTIPTAPRPTSTLPSATQPQSQPPVRIPGPARAPAPSTNVPIATVIASGAGNWAPRAGQALDIAIGANGDVISINSTGAPARWNEQANRFDALTGSLFAISVGPDGTLWGIDRSRARAVVRFDGKTWQPVNIQRPQAPEGPRRGAGAGFSGKDIAVGANGDVVVLSAKGVAQKLDPQSGALLPLEGANLASIAVAPDGSVWGLSQRGQIHHYVGSSWQQIGGSAKSVAVATDGAVYVVNSGGLPAKLNATTGNFDEIGGQNGLATIAVGAGGSIWATTTRRTVVSVAQ